MLLTSPGPERVQTMGCGRAECLGGLTFSSCDSHKSNVATLPPLRSPERQEDVLWPQSSMKAEQVQPRLRAANSLLSPSLLVIDDVHAPNVSCFSDLRW
jgi:hypothetical protein